MATAVAAAATTTLALGRAAAAVDGRAYVEGSAAIDDPGLPGRAELEPLLRNISDWILTTDVQTNNITHAKDWSLTSIFVNGNLARVLLAASRVFDGNATYLEAGLGWCDSLTQLQHHQATHDGRASAAGWWDTGYNQLYIADTGTAVTALAVCYDLVRGGGNNAPQAQPQRAAAYLDAMLSFADFVVNGTATTPKCTFEPGQCTGRCLAWCTVRRGLHRCPVLADAAPQLYHGRVSR